MWQINKGTTCTPPCRIPQLKRNYLDHTLCHLTHVIPMANQPSNKVIHFIKHLRRLRHINCSHVDCRTRIDIMINHTSENIDSLSTTRLFFESKLIITINYLIQYTVFKYFKYYWTGRFHGNH